MRHRAYNICVIGCSLAALIAVIGANAMQAMLHPRPTAVVTADADLGWRFCGQRNQRELRLGDFILRFDQRGCRGPEQDPAQLRGQTVFLGNSVTLGQQVPESLTFSALLRGINAGGDGYDTFQQIRHYHRDLGDLQPRRLILMISGIDLMTLEASRERQRSTATAIQDLAPWPSRLTDIRQARKIFSHGFQPTMQDDTSDPGRDLAYLAAANSTSAAAWRDWTAAVTALAHRLGSNRLVLVLSPPRKQVADWRPGDRPSELHRAMEELCSRLGVRFIDLLPALASDQKEALYCDHVHFSERGHARVAAILREAGLDEAQPRPEHP